MTPQQLFDRIALVAPPFELIEREHLQDYDGELLPHVLMAELVRFVGASIEASPYSASAEAQAILALLEAEISGGNPETENVIALSFLENLEAEPFFASIWALLGPKLRAAHAPFAWQPSGSQNAG